MTTTTVQENIKKAIGAHSMWKTRLRSVIETGQSEFTVEAVSRDNNCEFGKWLYGDPSLKAEGGAHYENVRKLHADFHKEVGRILTLALLGKRQDALKALDAGTQYAQLSASLTRELMTWSGS